MSAKPVIFIAGPTASGKTALAIALAKRLPLSLINVDSAQVYRGMDIGTAKLDKAMLAEFPHALIDIRDPLEVYDAAQFVEDARAEIEQAHQQGRIPVLVGGTLFYFSALEQGVSRLPQANASIRAQLEQQAQQQGWPAMHAQLLKIDPDIAAGIQAGDRQRIQRALEIHLITGQQPSKVMAAAAPVPLPYPVFKFNLYTPDRKVLHQRIAQRFEGMLSAGLLDEVAGLKARGDLHLDLPSMRCVGYRQVWQYLDGEMDQRAMIDTGIAATRQLAKRQLTWLRHQRGQIWLSSEYPENVELILPFIQQLA